MYKLLKDNYGAVSTKMVLRVADNATIPNDPANRDWILYQAWLAQGNTPEAA
jgi:hypothetical protein